MSRRNSAVVDNLRVSLKCHKECHNLCHKEGLLVVSALLRECRLRVVHLLARLSLARVAPLCRSRAGHLNPLPSKTR